MLELSYLHKLHEVLKSYFGDLNEETVRENFVLIYELMDEMMDNGIPQVTETKILREYIKTNGGIEFPTLMIGSTNPSRPPTAVTNAVSWRSEGLKYKKNEIFLDVVEKLNLLVAANGQILRGEILGVLKMKSFLSGMPELKLGLNDRIAAAGGGGGKSVELEDIKFHQCVRLSRFEQDRTIAFIPPDGDFELMSYRISAGVQGKSLIGVEVVVDRSRKTKLEYMVKVRSNFKSRSIANDVEISIPVASDADTPQFKTSGIGSAKYEPEKDVFVWSIKQLQGQKEYIMTGTFGLPSVEAENRDIFMKKPVNVKFEIPYFTVSGLTVRYLKIVEKSGYHALPWVRYITVNGDYQLRFTH
jgi:AP-1 complex subunit mu